MGLIGDELTKALSDLPPETFEAFPETVEALEVFHVVSTQWRMRSVPVGMGASMSKPFGLDYTACEVILRLRGITVSPETWGYLQIIERAIIENGDSSR